jgi:hypothetical protein
LGIIGRIAPLFSKMVGFLRETFSKMMATSYSLLTAGGAGAEGTVVAAAAAPFGPAVLPIRAFAADVERPVAVASAERGPERGVSGEPRTIRGFTCWIISGMSISIK